MNRRSLSVVRFGIAAALLATVGFASAAEPKFDSKIVSAQTKGHAVDVDVDITGAKSLFLVATDGGDGFGCDWADWVEPKLILEARQLGSSR